MKRTRLAWRGLANLRKRSTALQQEAYVTDHPVWIEEHYSSIMRKEMRADSWGTYVNLMEDRSAERIEMCLHLVLHAILQKYQDISVH